MALVQVVNTNNNVTWTRLLEVLEYNPETGIFINRGHRKGATVGSVSGCINKDGYNTIKIDGTLYFAHRLAWFYCFQEWPENDIDHIDRVRSNNRLDNLRDITLAQNNCNKSIKSNNKTGFKGVYYKADKNKYHAQITLNGKKKHLGYFVTAEEASAVYNLAAEDLFNGLYSIVKKEDKA